MTASTASAERTRPVTTVRVERERVVVEVSVTGTSGDCEGEHHEGEDHADVPQVGLPVRAGQGERRHGQAGQRYAEQAREHRTRRLHGLSVLLLATRQARVCETRASRR